MLHGTFCKLELIMFQLCLLGLEKIAGSPGSDSTMSACTPDLSVEKGATWVQSQRNRGPEARVHRAQALRCSVGGICSGQTPTARP